MTPFAIAGLLIVVTCFPLATLIFFRVPRSLLNNLMVLFNVSVGFWGLGTMLAGMAQTPSDALMSWRIAHVGGFPLGMVFYHMSSVISGIVRRPSVKTSYAFAFFGMLLCGTGLAMSDTKWVFDSLYYTKANIVYGILVLIWVYIVVLGHCNLFQAYRKTQGIERKQKQYVFYAMLTGFVGGSSTWLPMFGVLLYPYGNFSIPIYTLIVTYAIVRHKFLDVNFVIRKGLVYSMLVALITATYLVIVVLMERLLQGIVGYQSVVGTVVAAFVIALGFTPVRNAIQRCVDRVFFGGSQEALATENERLRHELIEAEKRKAVATMAAGMAHEIKNPLTAIKTFTEFLPEKYDDPTFREKFTRIVAHEVTKINDLVQRLLDFARPKPPQKQPVRLSRLIDETIELLHNALVEKHISVVRAYATADTVLADPAQVKQALLNILLNSIQAMERPGCITVSTVAVNGHLEVMVTDTGPGIAPQDLAHVFEPFYTTKVKGTGLGLSVVQRIVQEHGGRIVIDSAPGRGTTVRLAFVAADIRHQTSDISQNEAEHEK